LSLETLHPEIKGATARARITPVCLLTHTRTAKESALCARVIINAAFLIAIVNNFGVFAVFGENSNKIKKNIMWIRQRKIYA
jgi:hypothetical protein